MKISKDNYHKNNREKEREYGKKYSRERRHNDVQYRLKDIVSSSIRRVAAKNSVSIKKILHYQMDDLKKHLESQFDDKMTWENYGVKGWHIDHIIPQCVFTYSSINDIEFKMCWSLSNLRPMWAKENIIKNKYLPSKHEVVVVMANIIKEIFPIYLKNKNNIN